MPGGPAEQAQCSGRAGPAAAAQQRELARCQPDPRVVVDVPARRDPRAGGLERGAQPVGPQPVGEGQHRLRAAAQVRHQNRGVQNLRVRPQRRRPSVRSVEQENPPSRVQVDRLREHAPRLFTAVAGVRVDGGERHAASLRTARRGSRARRRRRTVTPTAAAAPATAAADSPATAAAPPGPWPPGGAGPADGVPGRRSPGTAPGTDHPARSAGAASCPSTGSNRTTAQPARSPVTVSGST